MDTSFNFISDKVRPVKVLVVSGFLGAGKTTFIRKLISSIPERICVLENEFGESEIDRTLLKNAGLEVWELNDGCICCSMQGSLINSVMSIVTSINPDMLIIEASGVALLSNIIKSLKEIEHSRIELCAPLVVVDAESVTSLRFKEDKTFINQINSASLIIVSKTESLQDGDYDIVRKEINRINPRADVFMKDNEDFNSSSILHKLINKITFSEQHQTTKVTDKWESICSKNVKFSSIAELITFMQLIVNGYYGDIARAKGFVNVEGLCFKLDVVNHKYSIEQYTHWSEERIVFIGKDLAGIKDKFVKLISDPV